MHYVQMSFRGCDRKLDFAHFRGTIHMQLFSIKGEKQSSAKLFRWKCAHHASMIYQILWKLQNLKNASSIRQSNS